MATSPVRGEIYQIDWHPSRGSEQSGSRPSLVIQTDAANTNPNYPNTIVATVSRSGLTVPTHVHLQPDGGNGLAVACYVKCEQIFTVSKDRLGKRYGKLTNSDMKLIDDALKLALQLL